MTGSLSTRAAGPEDWAAWRDLRLRALRDSPDAFGSTYEHESAFTEGDWRARLSDGPAVLGLVAGRAVGQGAAFLDRPGSLKVVAMWTDPAYRGRGVGSAVLDHLLAWAADLGLPAHLDVAGPNVQARALYERRGFAATGHREPLRPGSAINVERMDGPAGPSPDPLSRG